MTAWGFVCACGGWIGGGVSLLGTIAVRAPQAISTGPQDTVVLEAPAEASPAGASHLTASQPRRPPRPPHRRQGSYRHTHSHVQVYA